MDELRTNAKNLSQAEQYQIRKNIVHLLKRGHRPGEADTMSDVSRSLVQAIIQPAMGRVSMGSSPGSADADKGRNGYSRPGRNARCVLKRTQMVHPELKVISDHSS